MFLAQFHWSLHISSTPYLALKKRSKLLLITKQELQCKIKSWLSDMRVQWCIICQSFCFESLVLLVNKSLVKNQMIKKLTWPWLLRTIKCLNYLLPAKFFLSFICRCINLRSISWPSWTQLQWNFLKGYDIQWIKRNLNWLFTYFIFILCYCA